MSKTEQIKENILAAAKALITQSSGDIGRVTTRLIAQRAGVAVGLINYHFQSKEHLVELCVQELIMETITSFSPPLEADVSHTARLKTVVKLVADFLAANEGVSQVSILGDLRSPKADDNTMKTADGFARTLGGSPAQLGSARLLAFAYTSIVQSLFLRRQLDEELFGFSFYDKQQRDAALDVITDALFGSNKD